MKRAKVVWKVYGRAGEEQKETYCKSFRYVFSTPGNTRIIEVDNYDKTGTHDYAVVRITRNTLDECYSEFYGQLSDGIFENFYTGNTELVSESAPKYQLYEC